MIKSVLTKKVLAGKEEKEEKEEKKEKEEKEEKEEVNEVKKEKKKEKKEKKKKKKKKEKKKQTKVVTEERRVKEVEYGQSQENSDTGQPCIKEELCPSCNF